ncbi:hypothetical protein [Nostoc sp.]|uniref:hypothetical protein n=1 Tax=Nostoc sp. TaxID=1180 RepID=UPI002FFAFDBB
MQQLDELNESEQYTLFLLLSIHLFEAAKIRSITVGQLSVEKVFEICKRFDQKAVLYLIYEQLPYPSEDPSNDLVHKLRLALQLMKQEEYADTQ